VTVRLVAPLTEPFLVKRLVLALTLALLAGGALLALEQGLLALVAMALAAWPLPLRVRVSTTSLHFRAGLLEQVLPLSEISSARVALDPRPWSLRRRLALLVRRRTGRPLLLFADLRSLVELEERIRVGRGDHPTPLS
jgi:hypothetical protein